VRLSFRVWKWWLRTDGVVQAVKCIDVKKHSNKNFKKLKNVKNVTKIKKRL